MEHLEYDITEMVLAWPKRYDKFKSLVKGKDLNATKEYFLKLHKDVHFGAVYDGQQTICDYIWENLTNDNFSQMPIKRYMTVAWCFWHLYRIEDIVGNLLIAEQNQIFNAKWYNAINSGIKDTANALSYADTEKMSCRMNKQALKDYCIEVGKNTAKVVNNLELDDLNRKPSSQSVERILAEGGLTNKKVPFG